MESKHPLSVLAENTPLLVKIAGIVTNSSSVEIENLITSELGFLKQRFDLEPALQKCQPDSLLNCVKQSIRDNLTLNKTAGLVYIYPQNINVGTRQAPNWITVANYEPTPDGRVSTARQVGRILDIKRPKLTKNNEGKVTGGEVELLKPSVPSPRWEVIDFDESDIERWASFSAKKNKGNANNLYTSWKGGIDPEFMRAKIVKHALKKMGTNTNELEKITPVKIEPLFSVEQNEQAMSEVPTVEVIEEEDEDKTNPNAKYFSKDITDNL